MSEKSEFEQAIKLAFIILDERHVDPDSDICILARQFLRLIERKELRNEQEE